MKKTLLVLCLAALLAAVPAGAVDFSRYVALGDSLTAGFASNGLTEYYQTRAYPALLARQAGVYGSFELPLVSAPGIPNLLELVQVAPSPVIRPIPGAPGSPLNPTLDRPYNDLGVPGADLYDMLFTTGNIYNLLAGHQDNVMHDLILRDGEHTALEQAIGLQPTFITMWIGNNDILGAALAGTPVEGVTMTPVATFEQLYHTALGALVTNTSADIVVMTIPDVTAIPFVNSIEPYLNVPGVGQVPLIGSHGPLPADAKVTLNASALLAQGIGIPTALGGTGQPLPEDLQIVGGQVIPGVVLRAEEIAVISDRIAAFNQIIKDEAATFGAKVLDINQIFGDIAAGNLWVVGGIDLSADFLIGGLFSYDGIHPQTIGQALIAVNLIDLINNQMGGNLPQVNMGDIMCGQGGCGGDSSSGLVTADTVFSTAAVKSLMETFPIRVDRMRRGLQPVDGDSGVSGDQPRDLLKPSGRMAPQLQESGTH